MVPPKFNPPLSLRDGAKFTFALLHTFFPLYHTVPVPLITVVSLEVKKLLRREHGEDESSGS